MNKEKEKFLAETLQNVDSFKENLIKNLEKRSNAAKRTAKFLAGKRNAGKYAKKVSENIIYSVSAEKKLREDLLRESIYRDNNKKNVNITDEEIEFLKLKIKR